MARADAVARRGVVMQPAMRSALACFPLLGLPAFYDSFFYVVFYWIALATSWALLSGFALWAKR